VGDIAAELGIAKGSIFQHFGSKDGLFLEAYKESVKQLPGYLDAPEPVKRKGFFAMLRHRLENTAATHKQHRVHYAVMLVGNYGSGMAVKKRIVRFLRQEDPRGLKALITAGLDGGELRRDVHPELIASIVESTVERFQDCLTMSESHPELFHSSSYGHDKGNTQGIDEFVMVLRDALGTTAAKATRGTANAATAPV
jgi:AcrR family transcriptional regulator